MENWFNTAAGIAQRFSGEQGWDLKNWNSKHTLQWPSLSSAERFKKLGSPLLSSMLCEERRTGPQFTLVMKASSILFGSDGKHFVLCQTEEWLKPNCVKKPVKGRGGSVMVREMFSGIRSWASFTATWMQMLIRTSLSNMQYLPCMLLPISLQFHARQCSLTHCKTWTWIVLI